MAATEARMRELGLVDPLSVLALDEWEIERQRFALLSFYSISTSIFIRT